MSPVNLSSNRLILVADDDVMIRNLIRTFLQRKGFEVLSASNGKEVTELALAHGGTIDLLLTDVEMPVVDGISAYREIRTKRPGIKVLFMSGGVAESELPEPWPFLQKPFKMFHLLDQIEGILEEGARGPGANLVNFPFEIDQREGLK